MGGKLIEGTLPLVTLIEWNVRGGSLRNIESARISIPGTSKYDDSQKCYCQRAQLEETKQFWRGCAESLTLGAPLQWRENNEFLQHDLYVFVTSQEAENNGDGRKKWL